MQRSLPDFCDAVQALQFPIRYLHLNHFQGEFIMGPVCTVEFGLKSEVEHSKSIHYSEQISINTIPVISGPLSNSAFTGGMIASYLDRPLVVNGNIRDINEISCTIGYQRLAGFGNGKYYNLKQVGYPMIVHSNGNSFEVTNDDIVCMDKHGAIFIRKQDMGSVLEYINKRKFIDDKIAWLIRLGMPLHIALQERNKIKSKL